MTRANGLRAHETVLIDDLVHGQRHGLLVLRSPASDGVDTTISLVTTPIVVEQFRSGLDGTARGPVGASLARKTAKAVSATRGEPAGRRSRAGIHRTWPT